MSYLRYVILLWLMAPVTNVSAQDKKDRVEALRVDFIARRVSLTESEAEKFWPLYNEYHDKLRDAKRSARLLYRQYSESMTDEEIRVLANSELATRQAEADVHRLYGNRIREIIGHRKYMRLRIAEEQFRKEMLRTLRQREDQ